MAISPSGIDYFKIKPEDVAILDLGGNISNFHFYI